MSHIIIILALTLNLATNHLHAFDPELYTYTESPAEPELIHNGDGEIHLYFCPQDSIRANLMTTQQQGDQICSTVSS